MSPQRSFRQLVRGQSSHASSRKMCAAHTWGALMLPEDSRHTLWGPTTIRPNVKIGDYLLTALTAEASLGTEKGIRE